MHFILIKSDSRFPIKRKRVKKLVERVLLEHGLTSPVEVSLTFVGANKMRLLNRQYRQIDQSTTVLTFSQLEASKEEPFYRFPGESLTLGDLVVCYPEAQKLANLEGILVDEEIDRLIKHGLSNLLKPVA